MPLKITHTYTHTAPKGAHQQLCVFVECRDIVNIPKISINILYWRIVIKMKHERWTVAWQEGKSKKSAYSTRLKFHGHLIVTHSSLVRWQRSGITRTTHILFAEIIKCKLREFQGLYDMGTWLFFNKTQIIILFSKKTKKNKNERESAICLLRAMQIIPTE